MKTNKNNEGPKYDFDRLTQHLKINKYYNNIQYPGGIFCNERVTRYNFNKCERQFVTILKRQRKDKFQ